MKGIARLELALGAAAPPILPADLPLRLKFQSICGRKSAFTWFEYDAIRDLAQTGA
jgi:hypothetical protein